MKRSILILCVFIAACSNEEKKADAYGNFEVTEVTISAEQQGKILRLEIDEGKTVVMGEVVGLIDTTLLHLQKKQLEAKAEVLKARFPNISSELAVIQEQRRTLLRELDRFRRLADGGAVPTKQVDDLEGQIAVLDKRIKVVETQNRPLTEELKLIQVQQELLEEQMRNAIITVPVSGTVMLKLAEQGEMVTMGMPLFRIADLRHLILRVYVSGAQLDDFKIGQEVRVLTDQDADTLNEHAGLVTWVSSEAEFTPKAIQTREERTDLVYAVKIKVPNDGTLKIGMPAEVIFNDKEPLGE